MSPTIPEKPLEEETAPTPSSPTQADDAPDLDVLVADLKVSLESSQTLLATQATRLATLNDLEADEK